MIEKLSKEELLELEGEEEQQLEDLLVCPRCGTPFVNAYDSIAKKVSKHIYKSNCKCYKKDIRISVG